MISLKTETQVAGGGELREHGNVENAMSSKRGICAVASQNQAISASRDDPPISGSFARTAAACSLPAHLVWGNPRRIVKGPESARVWMLLL
jgi:hypothetical protein